MTTKIRRLIQTLVVVTALAAVSAPAAWSVPFIPGPDGEPVTMPNYRSAVRTIQGKKAKKAKKSATRAKLPCVRDRCWFPG